tara:strand:- start:250 stop:426 length:177 start_codon:yes stop_codon:yes gene_type:complete
MRVDVERTGLVREEDIPTAFSSMICWALVFAADMVAGLTVVVEKNLRRNEMVGNCYSG